MVNYRRKFCAANDFDELALTRRKLSTIFAAAMVDPAPSVSIDAPTLSAVLDRLRAYCRARDLTPGQLATEAGLSRGTLARFFEPDWMPTSSTVAAIERLLPSNWKDGDPLPGVERPGRAAGPTTIAAE